MAVLTSLLLWSDLRVCMLFLRPRSVCGWTRVTELMSCASLRMWTIRRNSPCQWGAARLAEEPLASSWAGPLLSPWLTQTHCFSLKPEERKNGLPRAVILNPGCKFNSKSGDLKGTNPVPTQSWSVQAGPGTWCFSRLFPLEPCAARTGRHLPGGTEV